MYDGNTSCCSGRSKQASRLLGLRQCGPDRAAERRLIEVKHGGLTVATYRYDGLGRRVLVTLHDDQGALESATRYLYDGDVVVQEYVPSAAWVLSAQYGNASRCYGRRQSLRRVSRPGGDGLGIDNGNTSRC